MSTVSSHDLAAGGPVHKTVTLKMVAESCGVSVGAVSQCLRNPANKRFAESTRAMILAKARELNYTPNRMAAGLREGRTRYLSLVVPWNTPEMLDAAELEAAAHGYGLSIHFTVSPDLEAERKAIQYSVEQRVDGLLWLPSDTAWGYTQTINRLRRSNTLTVFLEVGLPGLPEAGLVEVDYETSLIEVLQGYRVSGLKRLALFTSGSGHQMRARRAAVFKSFCDRGDLHGEIVEVKNEQEMAERLDALRGERCGLICEADWLGVDALRWARSRGVEFPQSMQLTVIGDILIGGRFRVGELCQPNYSAIRRPSGEMARTAVRLLIEALEKKTFGEQLPRRCLSAEFIPRETTEGIGPGREKGHS